MYTDDELFDILNERGERTGEQMRRGEVHRTGALHGSVHIWVVRSRIDGEEVLLQKRAADKDSYPNCYDAAATGHIDAGEEPLTAALREVSEEIGLTAKPSELIPLFRKRVSEDNIFHGKRFVNNEITWVYLFSGEASEGSLSFEAAEISELRWFPAEQLATDLEIGAEGFCVDKKELSEVLRCRRDMRGE